MTTAERKLTPYSHLTDSELISQLELNDDLTPLEHELLDRLITATMELAGYAANSVDTLTKALPLV